MIITFPVTFSIGYSGIIDFSSSPGSSLSSGPIIFLYTGNSNTDGQVLAYNDGVIAVTNFTVNTQYPIVQACINILKQTEGAAKKYKLLVKKNDIKLYTVRSVLWGSQFNLGSSPNYQLIDRQYQGSGVQVQ